MNQAQTLEPMPSTRQKLFHTALDLFSTHGYQSTSLRDLATELRVQPGSLYNHIENKQSLLFELMEQTMNDLLDQIRPSLKRRTAQAKLRLFVQALVAFQSSHPKKLMLIDRELSNLSGAQHARISTLRTEYAQSLTSVIDAVAGASLPKRRKGILVHAVICILHSAVACCENDLSVCRLDLIDDLTHLINGAIGAAKR